jgi:hypothetical protein
MVQYVSQYLIAVVGLVVGAVAGLVLAGVMSRRARDANRLDRWDASVTIPLLLAAAGAHLALVPVVELQRQLMFCLYVLALIVTVALALSGWRIWRLGAVLLPLGSILAYGYFAVQVHAADWIGLGVKLVELAVVAAALGPVLAARRREQPQRQRMPSG